MRNLSKFVAVISFILIAGTALGQEAKFGHIDLQALIQVMPERTAAEADYTKQVQELEEQLGTMQKELENKYSEYIQEFVIADKDNKWLFIPPGTIKKLN